ncbi:MAG: nicotinate-nucleotide--dimethylbenzimidazole phosphoribosyltransferase [Marinobacterium sp.]|nr:nicotinate-nucleotide--dimethylbenzimidazole phosphoribosyltransferase [Marinobacterium sp.]
MTEQADNRWFYASAQALNHQVWAEAQARQLQLTRPPGSLGDTEDLVLQLAAMQGEICPQLERIQISLFAADHGIAAQGVSAYPQAVTAQMVENFARGGAAISVAARQLGAQLEVVNLGTVAVLPDKLPGVRHAVIAPTTASFAEQPAMTVPQLQQALQQGREAALRAANDHCQLFVGGEMGIGNTTAATALACARLNIPPQQLAGPGTGLDQTGLAHKVAVIEQALARHQLSAGQPLQLLQYFGGFEIAALCGAYIAAAQQGITVLVDGFICTAAALIACALNPSVRDWLLFAHSGAEPGHKLLLDALQARTLLQLGLRLGEGSGAALAIPLLRMVCALQAEMATFTEAGVSNREP